MSMLDYSRDAHKKHPCCNCFNSRSQFFDHYLTECQSGPICKGTRYNRERNSVISHNRMSKNRRRDVDRNTTIWPYRSHEQADRTLEVLLHFGVNHIDVAASYGDAELRIAPWLAQYRSQFYVATKTDARTARE